MLIFPEYTDEISNISADFYNYNNTRSLWKFEYVGSGYYKIKNDITGYYLIAPNNNLDYAKVEQGEYNSTYGLWMIKRTEDGLYTLQSKNQYERTTSVPLYLSVNNYYVVQSSFDYMWNINALTLNLRLYYDQAFADTYSAIGIDAAEAIDNIVNNNTTSNSDYRSVGQFFKEEFGIKVNTLIVSDVYESYPYANDCLHKNDTTSSCNNCKDAYIPSYTDLDYCKNGYHHKSANKIVECTPLSNTSINIVFTGHRATCGYDGSSHVSKEGILGRAEGVGSGNRCAIFLPVFSNKTNYDSLKITFTHEILHLLNVSHHYETGTANCVHGTNRHQYIVYMGILICNSCISTVNYYKLKVLYGHNT